MKRITYSGASIVTGNAITAALLEYTTTVADAENSVTVDIPVLEDNGEISVHTLLLNAASQFDVVDVDVDGLTEEQEAERFPVPELPRVGISVTVEKSGRAGREADEFDALIQEIDEGLGE